GNSCNGGNGFQAQIDADKKGSGGWQDDPQKGEDAPARFVKRSFIDVILQAPLSPLLQGIICNLFVQIGIGMNLFAPGEIKHTLSPPLSVQYTISQRVRREKRCAVQAGVDSGLKICYPFVSLY